MNSKGEINIGYLITAFIAVIVGVAFLTGGISSNVNEMTATRTNINQSVTAPAEGSQIFLTGSGISGTPVIVNGTDATMRVHVNNFTFSSKVNTATNLVGLSMLTNAGSEWDGRVVNITYDYKPNGYINDSGGRSIAGLVLIFTALLIFVAVVPNFRNGVLEFIGGN